MSKSSGISDLVCALLSFNLFLRGNCTNWGHYTSNLANIATISLAHQLMHPITCGVYLPGGIQEAAEDKWQLICCLSPFLILLPLCWGLLSHCPGCNASVAPWISWTKDVQTVLHSSNIQAPRSPFSHGLWRHQSSNLLCFCWPGSLSVGLLPIDVRTT